MSDKIQKLVRMANEIAEFFRPYPEEKQIAGVQEHLRNFWTPAMRRDLDAYVAAGGEGLTPIVEKALKRPAKAEAPNEKVTAGPEELGELASDAG